MINFGTKQLVKNNCFGEFGQKKNQFLFGNEKEQF